ncbi:putative uncharacterized protein C5orf17 [Symphalangus syndactylus]|uniref:putative uncharacterized protein C5orf17 n=1 Tax=Symphalangus syndactylus TaxID=9590 RepID=UPI003005EB77
MPEPPTPSMGSCAALASPTSATPCSTDPSPINHPRAEECERAARDWQAAPPAAQVKTQEGAMCEAGNGPSPDTKSACTLILDFQSPEL